MKIKIELDGLTLEHATELTKFLSSLKVEEITADVVSAELEQAEVTQIKAKLTRKKAEKVDPTFYDLNNAEAPKTNLPTNAEIEAPQEETKAEAIEVAEPETISPPTLMQIRSLVAQKAGEHKDSIKAKLVELGAQNVSTLDAKHFQTIFTFLNAL